MPVRCFLLVSVLIVLASAAWAAGDSTIVPGDTIKITVLGEPEQTKEVVVDPDGRVALPLVKDIVVAGKTTADAASIIAEKLKTWIKNPDVTVDMVQKAKWQVTVAGQVKTPGVYAVPPGTRVMGAVGLSGGFLDGADQSKVRISRRGVATPIDSNILEFLAGRSIDDNPELREGDVILVPEKSPMLGNVFVFGSVKTPGQSVQLRDGMRVSQAISAAGGVVQEQADLSKVEIRRQGQPAPIRVDLAKAMGGDAAADVPLKPGDSINVPMVEQTGTFTVYGAVVRQGEFPLKGNMTVAKAVASCGLSDRAKISGVMVRRVSGAGQNPQGISVDLTRVAQGKSQDVPLQAGDTIYVPEKGEKTNWGQLLGIGVGIAALLVH